MNVQRPQHRLADSPSPAAIIVCEHGSHLHVPSRQDYIIYREVYLQASRLDARHAPPELVLGLDMFWRPSSPFPDCKYQNVVLAVPSSLYTKQFRQRFVDKYGWLSDDAVSPGRILMASCE